MEKEKLDNQIREGITWAESSARKGMIRKEMLRKEQGDNNQKRTDLNFEGTVLCANRQDF